MPVITVEMIPRGYERKAEIARVFTDELSRITGVPKDAITILFHDLTAEHVSKAGELLVERQKK